MIMFKKIGRFSWILCLWSTTRYNL